MITMMAAEAVDSPARPSGVASFLYREYVAHITRSQPGRTALLRKIWTATLLIARKLVILLRDPLVEVHVGKRRLLMPLSHSLPLYLACAPLYDRVLPRIAAHIATQRLPLVVVDVGANIGDTAALISDAIPDAEFLCIEGSEAYFPLLRRNIQSLGLHATCLPIYCSDGSTAATISASEQRGTGHLVLNGTAGRTTPMSTLDEIIARYPAFADPSLVKVDTDGFDYRVLRGANALLRRAAPLIFFEFDPNFLRAAGEDPLSIFAFLRERGYRHGLLYGNLGQPLEVFDLADQHFIRASLDRIDGSSIHYYDVLAAHETGHALFERIAEAELRAITS